MRAMLLTALIALIALIAAVAACHGNRGPSAADPSVQRARGDTVAVLEALWRAANLGRSPRRVRWLYLPDSDSSATTASEGVRAALSARGIPAFARLPAGDDTVVFRVHRWDSDSVGTALLDVRSTWTEVLRPGSRRCRAGSGNSESYRVIRTARGWSAERVGPVLHGDGVCKPIP